MSTYWPGQEPVVVEMVSICRFCGFQEHVARQFVTGCEQHEHGHEYVEVNSRQVGPVGGGTPAARMRWLWDQLREFEDLLIERGGLRPFSSSSTGMPEVALLRVLEGLRGD